MQRTLILTLIILGISTVASIAAADPVPVDSVAAMVDGSVPPAPTPIEVIETGKAAWSAFAAGSWVLGLGLLLTFVIQAFRSPWLGGVVEKIPARWRTAIPLALSGIASALLTLAGQIPPELAAMLCPAIAGVSIGAHEVGETMRVRRPRYRVGRAGLIALVVGCLLVGGCTLRAPMQPVAAGFTADRTGHVMRIEVASVADSESLLTWCRDRQERRWWSSALAQAAGVLAGGLAAAALARDDDPIELGLEIGSLVSAGVAAGTQTYSSTQASAYEQHCASAL